MVSSPINLANLNNINAREYFLTFGISGEMFTGSKLVFELLLNDGSEVDWVVKRVKTANTNLANASIKYRLKRNWFGGLEQSFRIRFTFYQSPSSDSFITISNLKLLFLDIHFLSAEIMS